MPEGVCSERECTNERDLEYSKRCSECQRRYMKDYMAQRRKALKEQK